MDQKICPLYKLAVLIAPKETAVNLSALGITVHCDGRNCAWYDSSNSDCSIKSIPHFLDRIAVK